jgi:hypothetical protein
MNLPEHLDADIREATRPHDWIERDPDRPDEPQCPRCGSTDVEVEMLGYVSSDGQNRGIPGLFTCRDCGYPAELGR